MLTGQEAKKRKKGARNRLKAMSHPLRRRILRALVDRGTQSPTELARLLEVKLSDVSYHTRRLEALDCIELVKTRPVRGAVEHFYRATDLQLIDPEDLEGLDPQICHPLRREILTYLIEHSTASPSEMAKEIDAPLSDISHHAKQLVMYGAVELVEERSKPPGGLEPVYRPAAPVIISTEEVEKMSAVDRQSFAGKILQKVSDDLRRGFQAGSFARRSEWNLSRAILDVDEEGLQRLLQMLERVEEEAFEIQAESVARRAESQDPPIRVSISHLCFVRDF